MKNEKKTGL